MTIRLLLHCRTVNVLETCAFVAVLFPSLLLAYVTTYLSCACVCQIYQRKSLQKAQKVGCLKNFATSLWPRTTCTLFCFTAPLLFVIAAPMLCFSRGGDKTATAISLRGTLVLYTYVLPVDVVGGRSVGFSIGILVLEWYHAIFFFMSFNLCPFSMKQKSSLTLYKSNFWLLSVTMILS